MFKVLFTLFLLFCSSSALCGPPSGMMHMTHMMSAAGGVCAASYGSDLFTSANATDLGGSETDAITGWTDSGTGLDSIDTGTPYNGTYHIYGTADAATDKFYRALGALSASTVYKLSFYGKHNDGGAGTGEWRCSVYSASSAGWSTGYTTFTNAGTPAYTNWTKYFLYNSLSDIFICTPNNAENDGGLYLDAISLTTATLCYGSELDTNQSAAAPSGITELNATTGFTAVSNGVITSDDTTPHDGTWAIKIAGDGVTNGSGGYIDLQAAPFSVTAEHKYFVRFWARHIGSGDTFYALLSSTTSSSNGPTYYQITNTDTTYIEYGASFVADATNRYLLFREAGAGNAGGLFIDKLSVQEIISE